MQSLPTSYPSMPVPNKGAAAAPEDAAPSSRAATLDLSYLDAAEAGLAAARQHPYDQTLWTTLIAHHRETVRWVLSLPAQPYSGSLAMRLRCYLESILDAGVHAMSMLQDKTAAASVQGKRWNHLLAGMLALPAWQWQEAPTLEQVPTTLAVEFANWLWSPPRRPLDAAETGQYIAHLSRRLAELARWSERNRGSLVVRAAMEAFTAHRPKLPAGVSGGTARACAEAEARILARLSPLPVEAAELVTSSRRNGRRLRVGFIARDFTARPATYQAFAAFSRLDPERFAVLLIALESKDCPTADCCRAVCSEMHVVHGQLDEQLSAIRSFDLDVAVFGLDLEEEGNAIKFLALHRVAALQVLNSRTGCSSGIASMDLVIGTTQDHPADFSERLGRLDNSFLAYAPIPAAVEQITCSRASLGISESAPLLAAVVSSAVTREELAGWAQILANAPEAQLAIAHAAPAAEMFSLAVAGELAEYQVDPSRVAIFPTGGGMGEVRPFLQLADIYVGRADGLDLAWTLEALALGKPAIACMAARAGGGAGAALLDAGFPQLTAASFDACLEIVTELVRDCGARDALAAQLAEPDRAPGPSADALAASDAFGSLLETAFDEFQLVGPEKFRQHGPLTVVATEDVPLALQLGEEALARGDLEEARFQANLALCAEPAGAQARALLARVLLARHQPRRAAEYMLAALEYSTGDRSLWLDLVRALHQSSQPREALQALEICLRVDPTLTEGWWMMLELAEGVGAADIAASTLDVLRELAPDDPRLLVRA